jgi:5'-nucleotidase
VVSGQRLETKPGMPESQELKKALKPDLDRINEGRKIPVAKTDVELDLRSVNIRTREVCFYEGRFISPWLTSAPDQMAASNWFADVLRHAYDDVACIKERGGADAIIFNAGALRGDSVYGPGLPVRS